MGEPSPAEPPDWWADDDDPDPPGGKSAVPPEPPWGRVLATTLRLWLERRGLRRPAGAPWPRWRKLGVLGLVLVVFAAGALTVALVRHASGHGGPAQGSPGLRAAAATRAQAAGWIIRDVSRGAIVACDPVMCAALQRRGFPSGSLLILGSSFADPLGSAVVVATAAVRSQLGHRLTSEYAPAVLASFGSGSARIDVRVTAADGAAAYNRAAAEDLQARSETGGQLLGNPHIEAPRPARSELAHGRVDSRLLITLAAMAAQDRVRIVAFTGGNPGASPGIPLRTAELASPPGTGAGYLRDALAFLRAQRAPYLASAITTTRLASGRTVLIVGFSAPSPLGLLGARAPAARTKAHNAQSPPQKTK